MKKKEFKFNLGGKSEYFRNLMNNLNEFNREYKCKVKFIEYSINNSDNIIFEEIGY